MHYRYYQYPNLHTLDRQVAGPGPPGTGLGQLPISIKIFTRYRNPSSKDFQIIAKLPYIVQNVQNNPKLLQILQTRQRAILALNHLRSLKVSRNRSKST